MHEAKIVLKNGDEFIGPVWINQHENDVLTLASAWHYPFDNHQKAIFLNENVYLPWSQIISAIEEETIVGMDKDGKAIVGKTDLLARRKEDRKQFLGKDE